MARPLRIEYPGAWYHVMNRGLARQAIVTEDIHRRLFLAVMGEMCALFGAECHAYCLMDTHYHLLLHTPRGNLGRCMRHVNGVYTQRLNRLLDRDGPLFRGRYRAIVVDADAYLLQVSRYIHRNPVEAGLVKRPDAFAWSSYRAYTRQSSGPDWLRDDQVLAMVGSRQARARYQAYVEQGIDASTAKFYGQDRQVPVLGDAGFRQQVEAYLDSDQDFSEMPQRRQLAETPSIEAIMQVCQAYYGVDRVTLCRDGRGRMSEARTVAIALCRLVGGHPLREIGVAFGELSYTGVASAVSRVRKRRQQDARFEQTLLGLERTLVDKKSEAKT